MSHPEISNRLQSRTVAVKNSYMHYLEAGVGEPLVFLHGNPTWSYLWRNVIPHLDDQRRCIAVDHIGMGRSGKPDSDYRLVDHIAYVEAFLNTLGLNQYTLVLHDWGVAVGLQIAQRYPEGVKGIVFMEGHIHPIEKWSDFDSDSRTMFQHLRSEALGQQMVIEENFFIETILPAGIERTLSHEEMEAYRMPYLEKHTRKPIRQWVREIPIENDPPDVTHMLSANQAYLASSSIPKLLLHATPGAVIGAKEVEWCKQHCPNLTTIDLGVGSHFLPEDHPDRIGTAISEWLPTLNTDHR